MLLISDPNKKYSIFIDVFMEIGFGSNSLTNRFCTIGIKHVVIQ